MSQCAGCKSERLYMVNAKCSDCCGVSTPDGESDGYVPRGINIGGGDYVSFTYCADCGKIQGTFPVILREEDR